jgi:hypothetical protein
MATWYIAGKRGMNNNPGTLNVATSSVGNSYEVELRINSLDANSVALSKLDVLKIVKVIQDYIEQNGITGNLGADIPPL